MLINPFSIVYADDDTDDHFMLQTSLRELNPNIILHAVYNGDQLIKLLENQHLNDISLPKFIITDINMPVMDGLEALSKLKSNTTFKEIPVYVLTTSSDEHTRKRCFQLQAKECYTKPYNALDLKEILATMILDCNK